MSLYTVCEVAGRGSCVLLDGQVSAPKPTNKRRNLRLRRTVVVLLSVVCGGMLGNAAAQLADIFRIDDAEFPISRYLYGGASYLRSPLSPRVALQQAFTLADAANYTATTLFDERGLALWSLRPAPVAEVFPSYVPGGPIAGAASVGEFGDDPSMATVGYGLAEIDPSDPLVQGGVWRFGLVNSVTQETVYGYEVSSDVGQALEVRFDVFGDGLVTLSDERSVTLLSTASDGSVQLASKYTSPAFRQAATDPVLLPFVDRRLDGGVDISLRVGRPTFANFVSMPESIEPTCVAIRLDTTGAVTQAFQFKPMVSSEEPELCDSSLSTIDGSLLFSFYETTPAGGERTHIIRFAPDGSLAWARTFNDAVLFPAEYNTVLLLSGELRQSGSSQTAGYLAEVDWETGDIIRSFGTPFEAGASPFVPVQLIDDRVIVGRVVGATQQGTGLFSATIEVMELDRNLQNPTARQHQSEPGWLPSNDLSFAGAQALLSEFEATQGQVRAVTLNADFQPLDPTCQGFVEVPVLTQQHVVATEPLEVTTRAIVVETAAADAPLTPVELPVRPLPLIRERCNGGLPSSLAAAVLPSSRSVQVGSPASAFATIINSGAETATDCSISPQTSVPADFAYQTTDASNVPVGTPNTPIDIPAGGSQNFIFEFAPTAPINPTDVQMRYDCTNTDPAPSTQGLNTLLLSASSGPVPDMVALAATLTGDGIVDLPGANGSNAFSVSTVNVGSDGTITAAPGKSDDSLPLVLSICETNPDTGACLSAAGSSATSSVSSGATPTYSVFVTATGDVPFDPAKSRIIVEFKAAGGVVRGSTSVAVRTQ